MFLTDREIQEIFKTKLRIETHIRSIDSLFNSERQASKTIYDPYYQRNYVWERDKASYFIESILLGTEIPPLVFFKSGDKVEVIDGRQRFETIKKFSANDLVLSASGLKRLGRLAKKSFSELDSDTTNLFWDTMIRVLEFSVAGEADLDEKKIDLIKKEIFRRYNSGITPLKTPEVDKAIFIKDPLTKLFKKKFIENNSLYLDALKAFLHERALKISYKDLTKERLMQKIRRLLVLHRIPIQRYAASGKSRALGNDMFTYLSETENAEQQFTKFVSKLEIIKVIQSKIKTGNMVSDSLLAECVFWALSVLEQEGIDPKKLSDPDKLKSLNNHILKNLSLFAPQGHHFYGSVKSRYVMIAAFIEREFKLKLTAYLGSNIELDFMKIQRSEPPAEVDLNSFENIRLNKSEPTTMPTEEIIRQMKRKKFLLRPAYQRGESIDRSKASSIIESVLLGIKLPPIFVYQSEDGINEVVDGQQRLLSILGFVGESFVDENGNLTMPEKASFALKGLSILNELNGKKYRNLPEVLRNKIQDFALSVVTIKEKTSPSFDPVDLFIRLNNKPYPIKEHTFEMWNSYIDKTLIDDIKKAKARHESWFHCRKQNTRMHNEELLTCIAYLEAKRAEADGAENASLPFEAYQVAQRINLRLSSKSDITKTLENATQNDEARVLFKKALARAEQFVSNIRILIDDSVVGSKDPESDLLKILDLKPQKVNAKPVQSFYILWWILSKIQEPQLSANRTAIRQDVIELMKLSHQLPAHMSDGEGFDFFKGKLNDFWGRFLNSPNTRTIRKSTTPQQIHQST